MSIEAQIGEIVGKSDQAVRFHAMKLMVELAIGRRTTVEEQRRIYNKCKSDKTLKEIFENA